jgi:RNA polymerase sigma-70 factor (ECF subfamily)
MAVEEKRIPVEEVISRYKGLLYYIIKPIVKDENLAEDCFGVICEIILKNYHKYQTEKGSLTGWLTRVARNGALNFVNNKKYTILATESKSPAGGLTHEEDQQTWAIDYQTPESRLIEKENRAELEKALSSLSKSETNILLRKYYYMQSTGQIAAELGMSERAVEGRLYRIRKKMMGKLGGVDRA